MRRKCGFIYVTYLFRSLRFLRSMVEGGDNYSGPPLCGRNGDRAPSISGRIWFPHYRRLAEQARRGRVRRQSELSTDSDRHGPGPARAGKSSAADRQQGTVEGEARELGRPDIEWTDKGGTLYLQYVEHYQCDPKQVS